MFGVILSHVVNYRPVILILLMLLSQAAQGMLLAQKTPIVCSGDKHGVHSCCAWLMEEHSSAGCGCMASRESSKEPAPASVPASTTRDLAAPCMATSQVDQNFVDPPAAALAVVRSHFGSHRLLSQPHVRWSVLFCSFLI